MVGKWLQTKGMAKLIQICNLLVRAKITLIWPNLFIASLLKPRSLRSQLSGWSPKENDMIYRRVCFVRQRHVTCRRRWTCLIPATKQSNLMGEHGELLAAVHRGNGSRPRCVEVHSGRFGETLLKKLTNFRRKRLFKVCPMIDQSKDLSQGKICQKTDDRTCLCVRKWPSDIV